MREYRVTVQAQHPTYPVGPFKVYAATYSQASKLGLKIWQASVGKHRHTDHVLLKIEANGEIPQGFDWKTANAYELRRWKEVKR